MTESLTMRKKRIRKASPDRTVAKIAAGGIGSFLMVLFFPQGVKYFFKHWFADLVRDIVVVTLAGLLTQKFAEILSRHASPTKRPSR